ncbi:hypothetical protein [Paraburkholderia sp.]|jgi:hypothetical protein|uniref:hypothetical protein n=1 Tax=Paraburkholderia sp. TaxID=1926495 RepID=UPI002F4161CE
MTGAIFVRGTTVFTPELARPFSKTFSFGNPKLGVGIKTLALHVYPDKPLSDNGYNPVPNSIQTLVGRAIADFMSASQNESSHEICRQICGSHILIIYGDPN